MKIVKVLNNNVVLSKDEKDNEVILMGRGLAFQKRAGDFLEESRIDKRYQLEDEISRQFQELLVDVPLKYLELATAIIDYAKETLQTPLSDSIYISVTDHLYTAIQRVKSGIRVRNILLWDIKRFYPDEFAIGKKARDKIFEQYRLDLGEDEAGFIALHLVNAQTHKGQQDVYELTELMQEITQIASYYFKTPFDEDSVYFYRFSTHLRFFAARIMSGKQLVDETDEELLQIIQVKYHNAYQCVLKIESYIQQKYSYGMTNDEKLYLTIHLARLVQKASQ
ncbi:BglG family transcription antiterminator LicT [Enterococcus asini]|uniref:BglG family transcription antiterminator LicT n=1 Tax=Enterococcus asini TaxID=57732 RepID=UPI001387661F|nr:PRD domain-containing protein [Enterococcus asini]